MLKPSGRDGPAAAKGGDADAMIGGTRIAYRTLALTDGRHSGTSAASGSVALVSPRGVREYADPYARAAVRRRFAHATWTSSATAPGFAFDELVPTWHAQTPDSSWVEVAARVRSATTTRWSRWLVLARWADHDTDLHPASVPVKPNELTSVAADTVRVAGGADAWQLRVTLLRPEADARDGPLLTYAGAMVSTTPRPRQRSVASPPGSGAGRVLDVPALSQRVHAGNCPQWGGGGEVWCSPTSIAMVLAYWGTGPDAEAISWVDPGYPDPSVYHAVRHCWDHAYGGAGNWSFNAAYAARFGLRTFVTRLRDLAEAETFIAAGIPLVASLTVDPARLAGAEYDSNGHLVVVAGFTAGGDVVVNDPAAQDLATLRRVYRRAEFERAWVGGSGGLIYVIHPPAVALPARPSEPNW